MRKRLATGGLLLLMVALMAMASPPAAAQDQQGAATPPYSLAEYNAYQAAVGQTNPHAQIQSCNDFVAKYPNSSLIPLVDELFFHAYSKAKDNPKTIEAVDKFMAIPDDKFKVLGLSSEAVLGKRLTALYLRALAFNQLPSENNASDVLTKARDSALEGLKLLDQLAKPANMSDDQFAQQKKPLKILFNYTAASCAYQSKDYKSAIDYFQAELADNPTEAPSFFRLGVSYLQLAGQEKPKPDANATGQPPAAPAAQPDAAGGQQLQDLYMNGFWALARAISLKGPGLDQMKSYLRAQMFNYEQPACGSLLDAQMNELIDLAGAAPSRPSTYSIPSAADLVKVLQGTNLLKIMTDLQAGGDNAKLTWLAVCGQEIPDVTGKIIDLTEGTDTIDFQVFTAATGEAIQAGTTANLDVKVHIAPPADAGANAAQIPVQPEASRLKKGDPIQFTGNLVGYDPQPFLLHFDKGNIDPKFIPAEKATPPKKHERGPGARGHGRG